MNKKMKAISIILLFILFFTLLPTQSLAQEITKSIDQSNTIDTPPVEEASKPEPKIVEEITDKREKNVKHFLKEDMTQEADVYPTAVHYISNGKWKDINNTLIDEKDENNNDVLGNKDNSYKVKIAKNTSSNKLVRITKDKYEISWNMENITQSKSQVVPVNTSLINSKSENEKKRTLSKLSSTVNFLNILPNTDLQYIVEPEGVKENIIINQRVDNPVYKFNISSKNLTAKLQEDKSIIFYDISDSSKAIFKLDKPFMYDKNGEQSKDINITLEKVNNEYILMLTPDNNWLSSSDRVYPVTIDPQVSTSLDKANIHDAHVTETYPTTNYQLSYMLKTGVGRNRTYVKFDLPALSAGDMVIGAVFNATLLSSNPDYRQVDVHKVLADWNDSTITWSNMPAYNTAKIEDYQNVKDMNIPYSWNVTGIVKDWYQTGNNYGLMLKNHDETTGYVEYYSTDTNLAYQQYRPQVTISYLNNSGLEGYWTYHSQSIGRAGTSYINDYNGNLI